MIKILITLLAVAAPVALAHPPEFESDGTNTILGSGSVNRTVFGENYGGYGYLASSESEAHQQLQLACDSKSQKQYLSAYCRGQTIDPDRPVGQLISNTMRSVVLYRLRTHASEYLALNIKAAATSLGQTVELERPECVDENSPLWQRAIQQKYNSKTKMSAKAEAIDATLQGKNLALALMYGERLEAGSAQNSCESLTGGRGAACNSIQHTSYRLHNSFPALFNYAVQGTENSPTPIVHKAPKYNDFRGALCFLMGAHNAGTLSEEQIRTRGEGFLEDGTALGPYRGLEDRFNQALEAASREPASSMMGKAYREYRSALRRLKQDHLGRMKEELARLCKNKLSLFGLGNHDRVNIYSMALNYPNVVRQTILDMTPSERGLTSAVLCDSGALPVLQREPQCNGVTGGPLPDNEIDVARRKINDWPNGSQNYFRLSRPKDPPGAPITVKLNVNFALGPSLTGLPDSDSNGIPDALECKLRLWQEDMNSWANCSVGAVASANLNTSNQNSCPSSATPPTQSKTCPMHSEMRAINPKIKFEINLRPTSENPPPSPSVQIHRCYRLEIPGTPSDRGNCDKVKEWHVSKCITEHPDMLVQCVTAGKSEEQCRTNVTEYCRKEIDGKFAANPASLNRADSSNYSLDEPFSVVRHEVFHQMGLPDEYYSDERPYSLLGEHNSIMRSSRSLDARLYPRHVSQILDVLRCPEVSGELSD
ncbi:MAG: hypothetical protein A2X86_10565 [Bdellovibrionales bacterium GWA2_49_15]|nr:MAG: hypothetical protein A2X86_10565 [Bdellovibrionales bacterium GWA2_49_15]HAZ11417.1 hypothetical protein [Bdellovibrionales bacterium]